jgi:hypothetical protein
MRQLNVLEFREYVDAPRADAAEIIRSVVKARGWQVQRGQKNFRHSSRVASSPKLPDN